MLTDHLKSCQSTKIHTAMDWEKVACEWAQESVSTCRRSNIGLPIYWYPYAIYTASNIYGSYKYDILSNYALFIAINAAFKNQMKPNNSLNEAVFLWAFCLENL